MEKLPLSDNGSSFDVTLLEAIKPSFVVLFAVGRGGNPERHLPLLVSLAENGCTVVAPHFERLASTRPTEEEMLLRTRRLQLAMDIAVCPDLPVVGIGHSIGATSLVALAAGQIWISAGQQLHIKPDMRIDRLVLLAPATDFFKAPGALDAFHTPVLVWAGTNDVITPLAQANFLKQCLGNRVPVEVRIVEGAGHFSFMNTPPALTIDPFSDREGFLDELAVEIHRFIAN